MTRQPDYCLTRCVARDRDKTLKPRKELPKGRDKSKTLNATMKATLGGGAELKQVTGCLTLRQQLTLGFASCPCVQAVKLPPGEDLNEWIAVNSEHCTANASHLRSSARAEFAAVHFYNAANMIYGTCAEFCTEKDCPSMNAGHKCVNTRAVGRGVFILL